MRRGQHRVESRAAVDALRWKAFRQLDLTDEDPIEPPDDQTGHTRSLMADRQAADLLNLTDPNRTLNQLVGSAYRSKGLVGDDLWEYLAGSASRSRTWVNDAFGL